MSRRDEGEDRARRSRSRSPVRDGPESGESTPDYFSSREASPDPRPAAPRRDRSPVRREDDEARRDPGGIVADLGRNAVAIGASGIARRGAGALRPNFMSPINSTRALVPTARPTQYGGGYGAGRGDPRDFEMAQERVFNALRRRLAGQPPELRQQGLRNAAQIIVTAFFMQALNEQLRERSSVENSDEEEIQSPEPADNIPGLGDRNRRGPPPPPPSAGGVSASAVKGSTIPRAIDGGPAR